MSGPRRIAGHSEPCIRFTFDGRELRACAGETLAAALLANGIGRVGRSFKYHRPRGILGFGVEEPTALVTIGENGRTEPNTRATDVYVYDGLVARSQNRWPSLHFDMGAVNGILSRFLPAGFYYKTFFGPPSRWMFYEKFIRRAAGMGAAPCAADPDYYDHRSAFCDVLVIGGGTEGIEAARKARETAHRVILVEQDAMLGGAALGTGHGGPMAKRELEALGLRVLMRTTAAGLWDHGFVTLVQRLVEPGQISPPGTFGQRLWHVRAARIILATGAMERPLTFAGNDRPGVMLAHAVRGYIHRHCVLPGERVVIATNNDHAYRTASAVAQAGGEVVAILDSRPQTPEAPFPTFADARPIGTQGARHHLTLVEARIGNSMRRFDADLLAMSGGFTPVVHLHSQAGGLLDWREDLQAFVPGAGPGWLTTVGGAAGAIDAIAPTKADVQDPKHSFVDFQNDVTVADIDLAWREGYRSVEHLKRYTTLGMATDQGKTSNMAALARLASAGNVTIPAAGLTTFRPPYTPVTLGALAGADSGGHAAPTRRLALFDRHQRHNPLWQPLGYWHRPRAYPRAGEDLHAAASREARTVRTSAGMIDVSTLAKFAVKGPDAATLLEIACATKVATLAVGRGRYTFMCREDGMIFDDGTVWRLAETEWLLTSSTGGADRMEAHLSYIRHVLAPHLKVSVVPQQEHFAAMALAGPQAAVILQKLIGTSPPRHMHALQCRLADVPVLVLAASYSGERGFEVYARGHDAEPVWNAIEAEVGQVGGSPYGLEALEYLRIEKGHIGIGTEVDGRTTPNDLGLGRMLRSTGGFVGAHGLTRPHLSAPDRHQLVGLVSAEDIPEGAMLILFEGAPVEGHVTSAGPRVLERGGVALALLANGRERIGSRLVAASPTRGRKVEVTITEPLFHDAEGARYRD